MKHDYYLIKNQETILNRFSDQEETEIKPAFDACLSEAGDFDDIEVWKVPSDVFVARVPDIINYGTNVTSNYLDEGDFIIL